MSSGLVTYKIIVFRVPSQEAKVLDSACRIIIVNTHKSVSGSDVVMRAHRFLPVSVSLALASSAIFYTMPAAAKTVTLRVTNWLADASEGKLYKNWVARYEKEHPNVKIKLDLTGSSQPDKVLASYIAGTPPDIYRIPAHQLTQFALKGLIRAIEGPMLRDININDLLKSVIMSGSFKGKLYGWDPHISGSTLDYNTDIFDKAGLPYPTHGFTWDDLTIAAKKTTITQSGKTTQWGFQNSEAVTLWRLLSHCYDSQLWDIKTGEPQFLADGIVKAVEMVRKMTLTYSCMPTTGSPYGRTAFAEGKLAMVVEGSFMNPTYMSSKKLKYKVTWTPKGTVQAFMPWPCMWVMSKNSKNPREQWDFYSDFLGLENSMEFTDFGGPRAYGAPVWKSALKNPKYKVCDMLNEQITQDEFTQPEPRLGFTNTSRFEAEAEETLWKIFGGKMDIRQGHEYLAKRSKVIMKYLGR